MALLGAFDHCACVADHLASQANLEINHTKMEKPKKINRRDFIRKAELGTAEALSWPLLIGCKDKNNKESRTEPLKKFQPDIDLELSAVQREKTIFSGNPTKVWTFEIKLIEGDQQTIQQLPGSYLGPVIRVKKGQKIRIRFKNNLPEATIVHWHGMHVPEQYDTDASSGSYSSGTV